MTLTTLSSKDFCSLFKWALKRNRSVMIIFSIFLALGPILDMYVLATMTFDYDIELVMEDACIATLVIYSCVTAVFVLISAIRTFSFLHNKRSVDMFGALPTNRTTLLVSHLCAGITSICVPYTVASIITMGITARTNNAFSFSLVSILSTILMIIAAYIFTALMAYCCGTVVDTVISTLAINGIWLAGVALCFGFMESLIPGATFSTAYSSPLLTAFTPYGFGLMGICSFSDGYLYYSYGYTETCDLTFFISTVIWDILYIVGFFILTLFVANKRKAESSQDGFSVKWLPNVIKAGVSVVAGGLLGFTFASTSALTTSSETNNLGIYFFWYIIVSFVAFAVLHVIFARGKGKILQSAIIYIATTIASLALVIGMSYGMGIDTYVPSADSIKSVCIDNYELQDPENIQIVTELHQAIVDGLRSESKGYPYYFGSSDCYYSSVYDVYDAYYYNESSSYLYSDYSTTVTVEEEDGLTYEDYVRMYPYVNPFYCNISYNKKLGFDVERTYYITAYMASSGCYDMEKINSLIQRLVSSEEYKKLDNSYIFDEASRPDVKISSVTLTHYTLNESENSYYMSGSANLSTDEEFLNGLYEALKKDILADSEYVIGYSESFSDIIGSNYALITTEASAYGKDEVYYVPDIYIKDSYTNTYDYLTKNGITITPSFDLGNYNSSSYYDDFNAFVDTGNYYYLKSIVTKNCKTWAVIICENLGIDYDEWADKYYDSYATALLNQSSKLFKEMQEENGYGDAESSFIYEYAYYIPTTEEAEALVGELMAYATEYITDRSGLSSDTDTDETTSEQTASDNTESTDTQANQTSSQEATASEATQTSSQEATGSESTESDKSKADTDSSKENTSAAQTTSSAA